MIVSFPFPEREGERLSLDAARGIIGSAVRNEQRREIGKVTDLIEVDGAWHIEMKISGEQMRNLHIDLRTCSIEAQGTLGRAEWWK